MKKVTFSLSDSLHKGQSGNWWHDGNRGPLKEIPFIRQYGNVKVSKINLDENMGLHVNNGIEIHYVKSGKHTWFVENDKTEKTMYPGDLSITAPWVVHGTPNNSISIGHLYWIVITPKTFGIRKDLDFGAWSHLTSDFQKELGLLISNNNGIVLPKMRALENYFESINKELINKKSNYVFKIMRIIEMLMVDLYREIINYKELEIKENNFIQTLIEMVEKDIANKWEVEELGKSFGMGKTMFTEKVRNLTGFPPQSFIINLRVNHAKSLLKENNFNLTDIALQSGFCSIQHFTSTFKQRTGKTPSEFKKKLQIL